MKYQKITFIKNNNNQWTKIDLNQITYIEASDNKSIIYLENGKTILCNSSLYKVQNSLPIGFERIHRTYIVNMHQVCFVNTETKYINLNNNIDLHFGMTYKNNIQRYFIKPNTKMINNQKRK